MVVPDLDWCKENGYVKTTDNQGVIVNIPQYERAFTEYPELNSVIREINDVFSQRGYDLNSLQKSLESINNVNIENAVNRSEDGQFKINENMLDKIRRHAKSDYEISLYWRIIKQGPRKRVEIFRITAFDSYTNNQIANSSGSGQWVSSSDISDAELLKEAVISKTDDFIFKIRNHFDDLIANGRIIKLSLKKWDNWKYNFYSEDFGGDELKILIKDWVKKNANLNNFSPPTSTQNEMEFSEVRIPFYGTDAEEWANNLRRYLKSIGVTPIRLDPIGLGMVQLIIGSK
jgi:hypothetical protein